MFAQCHISNRSLALCYNRCSELILAILMACVAYSIIVVPTSRLMLFSPKLDSCTILSMLVSKARRSSGRAILGQLPVLAFSNSGTQNL